MPETPRVWAMTSQVPALGQSREILRLAVPAFLALVAEPLFLLADSAIIGHLGTAQLAGLGVASATLLTAANIGLYFARVSSSERQAAGSSPPALPVRAPPAYTFR